MSARDNGGDWLDAVDWKQMASEIGNTPHWVHAAFAARCLRRVAPLVGDRIKRSFGRDGLLTDIESAVAFGQHIASSSPRAPSTSLLENLKEALEFFNTHVLDDSPGYYYYAAPAIGLAISILQNRGAPDPNIATQSVFNASANFFGSVDQDGHRTVQRAVLSDIVLASSGPIQNASPPNALFGPALFGPLWPEGEPDMWPEDLLDEPDPFEFVLDPGDAEQSEIQEVLTALSDLHAAHTGYSLHYRVQGSRVMAHAEVES